jgi:hypothetical protein
MHLFVFEKKQVQDMIVVVLNSAVGFGNTPFITFFPVEINIIMRSQVMEIPGKRSVLLHGTGTKAAEQ